VLGEIGVKNAALSGIGSWGNAPGGTLTVNGRFVNGFLSAAPAGSVHCSWGDRFRSIQPGNGGQPVNGWYCSNPATPAWTAF